MVLLSVAVMHQKGRKARVSKFTVYTSMIGTVDNEGKPITVLA